MGSVRVMTALKGAVMMHNSCHIRIPSNCVWFSSVKTVSRAGTVCKVFTLLVLHTGLEGLGSMSLGLVEKLEAVLGKAV